MDMKEHGLVRHEPEHYRRHRDAEKYGRLCLGVLAFLSGFGLVWHIWWLVVAAAWLPVHGDRPKLMTIRSS